ncbi:MAG: type II CAAX endopeptidase family protein [Clostridia bacterium]|nr:type II CAAX endopeptidase family protein [Clostridia bacterium]
MQQLTNQERLRPWMGFILAAVSIAALLFAGSAMQHAWGLWGLAATEIMMLALAVGYCLIFRVKLKEVFPVRRITGREFGGVMLLLAGGYGLSMVAVGLSMTILPSSMQEIEGLNDFLYSGNNLLLLIPIATILPAICEEAIMRGAILSSFRSWKKGWLIVLVVGIIFGIFHLSPLRFLNTACLGMILAFLMVKRNNILLPMLLHFLNNLIAVGVGALSSFLTSAVDTSAALASAQPVQLLGTYLIAGCSFPMLLTLGAMLISPETHKKKRFLFAGIVSGALLLAGISLTVFSMVKPKPICDSQIGPITISQSGEQTECEFNVTESKPYTVSIAMRSEGGTYTVILRDESGTDLLKETAGMPFSVARKMNLETGHYYLILDYGEDTLGQTLNIRFTVQ